MYFYKYFIGNVISITVQIDKPIIDISFFSKKSGNCYTFILKFDNCVEKGKWLEVISCIKDKTPIPQTLIGYGEKKTVNIQPINPNQLINNTNYHHKILRRNEKINRINDSNEYKSTIKNPNIKENEYNKNIKIEIENEIINNFRKGS